VTINGNSGNDVITGSSAAANTISGGLGNDTITGGAVADAIDGGDGTDTFVANLTEQVGASTTVGAVINLSATALTAASVNTATSVFLTATNASVASNTATYLYSSESNTNADVVDTLTSIESVTGTSGADYIVGSATANVITGGAGADVLTGGAGADTFVFAAGDTGTPSATNFDKITDFASASDVIDYTAAITIVTNGSAAAVGVAAISAAGIATFAGADDELGERITAVEGGIATGTAAAGQTAAFMFGSDAYVFISDGVDGVGANDVLIRLAGVDLTTTAFDLLTISAAGNLTIA
jgi:Ca2+-binding RTX toxin-like protein